MPRRRFILVPNGSAGDMNPFAWLAEGLRDAGHEVVAVVHPPFGELFRAVGVKTAVYDTAEAYDELLHHPDLWHPTRGFPLLARTAERFYRAGVPCIRDQVQPGRTTLVGAGIAYAARIAAEAFDVPLITVQLQPLAFLSVDQPPVLRAGWEWFSRSPRWVRKVVYRVGLWNTDWLLAGPLNTFRAELGLTTPVRQVLGSYWMSSIRVLALFPDWYSPRQPDWPPQTLTTRFPLFDGMAGPGLHPEVEDFLRDGSPPIVFAPGSANRQAERFFEVAAESCRRLGFRGLFLTPFAPQLPASLPPGSRGFERAPFSRLFPRCRAIVHHGGIGTTSQALAAGVPQLLMPMSYDQPDNARRVRQLGVGDSLYPRHFTPDNVVAWLRRLLGSRDVARACRDVRERLRHQMSLPDVVRLLEEIT